MYSLAWPYAHGTPKSTASFKLTPEDFQVNELFTGQFSGEGEHIMLRIEKRGLTTEEVVRSLARLINKPAKLISYAGLKDKYALTTQWFSVHVPGQEIPGIEQLAAPGWRVLEHTRNNKKLRPGFLTGNQFVIQLKDVTQIDDVLQRLELIKTAGVPNYFGEQRFGRQEGNLVRAEELLVKGIKVKDRFLKGIYYSAARSWIYNLILARRVEELSWNRPLDGDVMQLGGTHSIFVIDEINDTLLERIHSKDLSPASPLPGKGKNMVKGQALALIKQVYQQWETWIAGLEQQGLEEAWRANILHVEQCSYQINDTCLKLTFTLPAGCYATVVLRELTHYQD